VTCDQIESWRSIAPNRWVKEERRYPTNTERLTALIQGCDAALALPGGIGTLAEVAVLWSQLQIGAVAPRPFFVIGPGWSATIEAFRAGLGEYIPYEDSGLVTPVGDVDEAFQRLSAHFETFA
jgi:predicted Rossmann-fold nucleotide-binding protein